MKAQGELERSYLFKEYIKSDPDLVAKLFIWIHTPEGNDYWAELENKLCAKIATIENLKNKEND